MAGAGALSMTIPVTLPEQPASSSAITTVEIVGLPVPTPTPTPLPLANGDWAVLTDPNDMNEVAVISNTLWIAGNGGGLAWSKGSTTPVVYTAADGLYGNRLTAVADCALPGFGVVFGSPAGLQAVDARTGRWHQINRTTGQGKGMRYDDVATLYCDAENGFLIVGYAEHGIDIYDANREQWRHLDRSSGLAANDVNDLAVVATATKYGLLPTKASPSQLDRTLHFSIPRTAISPTTVWVRWRLLPMVRFGWAAKEQSIMCRATSGLSIPPMV